VLTICDLHAGYGVAPVLRGVHAQLAPGEIVAVLGRNGSGRSTLAKALMGLVPWRGTVHWAGQSLAGKRTFEIARMGIGYVPESRDIFAGMSVHRNLLMGQRQPVLAAAAAAWDAETAYRMFPALDARREVDAALLSGGEQQMLALCRCLMGTPRLLIVDEPTEGLAPALVAQVAQCLLGLRKQGVAVLLMEQKRMMAMEIADRVLVMGQGRIVFAGLAQELQDRSDVTREWLQV